MKKNKALFLDRDGVINIDYGYVYKKTDFHFLEGIFELVVRAKKAGYCVVVVTNQAGIGRGHYTEGDFYHLMEWVNEQFAMHSTVIDAIYFCPYHAEQGIGEYKQESFFRKPAPGMLLKAAKEHNIDLPSSIIIGDKISDMQAGHAAGIRQLYWLGGDPHHAYKDYRCIDKLEEIVLN
ncbi:D-glycero-alpha-D-manno-heptose-1,7-bisphosphate 7-phosphatase [Candidatus Williamhamiltonella defendens]|uniref:D,D-heptose 1,7-bisphosphate phosphatase n=1 Tax=Candidatus Hamiltonella defensa (Bemisia tabaci) TaxID=672795 RepID=A0A249DXR1_9ENTR|nr:HAD family hydrolase [Candidatus Hamiltonella defensa]ASX26334.1 D,D-heptose 1,7-bisphosphate phosphatase [Candidatus Hamiltonella defensa (Bemisia tabaci)]CED79652.1 D,D-heptose 1,7-bisphosphate phosphatase [Candidatus Hamiltonella defensa (Bemisia tabaci)]